jgi:hypothetical protein
MLSCNTAKVKRGRLLHRPGLSGVNAKRIKALAAMIFAVRKKILLGLLKQIGKIKRLSRSQWNPYRPASLLCHHPQLDDAQV